MPARYLNPYTDFGFKKLFGEAASRDLLRDFLNSLLPEQHQIAELSFTPNEQLPEIADARQAIFDIFCKSASGERFIVEMQKAKQNYFKDRTVFYSTFPLRDQAQTGEWNFHLSAVYCVGILDFVFDPASENQDVLTTVTLKDQYNEVFYDKLTYLYLQMPNFAKTETELTTHFDKWLYFLKHLATFEDIPAILREPLFERGFRIAEIANFNKTELSTYENSLKVYWDLKNVIDTARDEGVATGIEEGRKEGRREGIQEGMQRAYDLLIASGMTPDAARRTLQM